MRLTDDRYAGERRQFELALRMIRHEARTRTIRDCTGLSDDRIRKLYSTYFRRRGKPSVRRRRGKSPQQVSRFVKNPLSQLEATTLVALFAANLLVRIDDNNALHPCWPRPDVEYGHRLCRAFETYQLLHRNPQLTFEWAWNLLQNVSRNDELFLSSCRDCRSHYVQDAYALDHRTCPGCEITRHRHRRPGSSSYARSRARSPTGSRPGA
ncbi:MAG: FlhC family transcriptional regulator [Woeseiaceae bacterium]|nr:FlhC family transcriptional regulator [Woeseiaceae bacterium]